MYMMRVVRAGRMGGERDALIEGLVARASALLRMEGRLCEGLQVVAARGCHCHLCCTLLISQDADDNGM